MIHGNYLIDIADRHRGKLDIIKTSAGRINCYINLTSDEVFSDDDNGEHCCGLNRRFLKTWYQKSDYLWTQQSEDSRQASASSLEHWLWSASHAETWSLRTRPETWSWSVASAWSVICLTRTLWDWNVQFLFYLWILGWTQEQWLFSLVENLIWCLPSITTDISLSWKIFLFRVRWESMINWLVLVLTEDELYKERTL